MLGIPTMLVTRKGFTQVAGNAFAGFGFPAEGPTVYEFPMEMFIPGSDLTPLQENIDKIVYGLTKWQPEITTTGVFAPPMVTVQGKDYEEALANMNLLFLRNLWTDGLPLLPATKERVDWILTGTGLARDTVVGKVMARGGIATVETIAVSLAMAGGRPEYLPVLIAAMQAMLDPAAEYQHMAATTCSNYPAVIVSGPIAKQIRLNSGYGLLGPDPQHSAGATIGRAMRLLQMNVGGAIPGIGTMAIFGGMRYTNAVFAEDEDGLPPSWPSLAEERGFPKGSSVVTIHFPQSAINMLRSAAVDEKAANELLYMIAGFMRIPNGNYFSSPRWDEGAPGIILMPRMMAGGLVELGWTKDTIREFLWENSKIPYDDAVKMGMGGRFETHGIPEGELLPISKTPETIMIVVAGGEQSGHSYFMPNQGYRPVSHEITMPSNWEELLKQAETDLGPLPAN